MNFAVNYACTDPTYKEWKQSRAAHYHASAPRTDPTYKEWKLPS